MKKFYSFGVLMAIAGALTAQNHINPKLGKTQSAKYNPYTQEVIQETIAKQAKKPSMAPGALKMISTEEELGVSVYDLQSNGSICPRIIADDNGVAATFTFSAIEGGGSYTDRGTGYNFRSAATNTWEEFPSSRIENIRTGWSSLLHLGNGSEMVISHSGAGGVKYVKRDAVGTGNWSTASEITTASGEAILWPRATNGGADGNTVHIVAITDPNNTTNYNGLGSCLLYYRSTDGGATWDVTDGALPEMNSNYTSGVTADTYAIHARGNTVVISVFGELQDSYIYVSEDNGTTWTKTVFWDFPMDNYAIDMGTDIEGDGIQDTILSSDGTGSLYIDVNNNIHIAFGTMFYTDDLGVVDSSYSYFPLAGSIAYWNSNMTPELVGQDSIVVGQDSVFAYNEIIYTNEIDYINSVYATDTYYEYQNIGGGLELMTSVVAAPDNMMWSTLDVVFTTDNGLGIYVYNGVDSVYLESSNSVDISGMGLGSDFDFYFYAVDGGVMQEVEITFNGTYNTAEIVDTVYIIDSVIAVYDYFDIYEYVDVFNYNNSVLEIGVSPEIDTAIPADITEVGQYGNSGIASHPQVAGDADGNIYVAYAAVNELYFNGEEYLRHVFAVKSTDAGFNWTDPADITPDLAEVGWEYMYASMAHEVYNGKLHLVIQKDEEPGVHVQPEDIADPVGDNIQIYLAISTDLVPSFNEGVDGVEANAVLAYPNPTSNNFTLVTESFVGGQLAVYDAMGRIVMKDTISVGKTNVSVLNWNKGVYHLVVNKGTANFQTSLVVE
jgi:hypothetical protein